MKNLLELPIEDFEAVANLFGVFYRVEFGSHGSTELGPSVYIAGVRLKGSRDFSLEAAEFSRPFRTKRGGVFLPAALLLLRTLHHALKQRPKLVLCIRSVPTTVNYPSFCEIKAWTIWTKGGYSKLIPCTTYTINLHNLYHEHQSSQLIPKNRRQYVITYTIFIESTSIFKTYTIKLASGGHNLYHSRNQQFILILPTFT